MGETFTTIDAYLFTVTRWAQMLSVDLSKYSHLQANIQRVAERPVALKTVAG